MSNHLVSLTYTRKLGSNLRKSVLALLADKASDDGSGIFASKQTIADELDCSKRAVIETIKAFVAEGIMREIGHRRMANGYTVEYGIVVEAVEALQMNAANAERQRRKAAIHQCAQITGERGAPVNEAHVTGEPGAPKPPLNPPVSQKTSSSSVKRASKPTPVPSNFVPVVKDGSITAKAMAAWPPGEVEIQVEHFIDRHTATGTLSKDWQASWRTWVKNWKKFNGSNGRIRLDGQSDIRGQRPDPCLDLLYASRKAEAQELPGSGWSDHRGAWTALPALGTG